MDQIAREKRYTERFSGRIELKEEGVNRRKVREEIEVEKGICFLEGR